MSFLISLESVCCNRKTMFTTFFFRVISVCLLAHSIAAYTAFIFTSSSRSSTSCGEHRRSTISFDAYRIIQSTDINTQFHKIIAKCTTFRLMWSGDLVCATLTASAITIAGEWVRRGEWQRPWNRLFFLSLSFVRNALRWSPFNLIQTFFSNFKTLC